MNNVHQLTSKGKQQLIDELKKLQDVDKVQNNIALKEAREQGDLSENADYDAARNEQARIESRINELERILKTCVVIDSDGVNSNIGKSVYIKRNGGNEIKYSLVGSYLEVKPLENIISIDSPLGSILNAAKVGDKKMFKTVSGKEQEIEVIRID